MTPGARVAAAISVLDQVLSGEPVERALTNWGRASRFAGSGDRGAVRDLVFSALRCRRSYGEIGGAGSAVPTGRQLMLGHARAAGLDVDMLFSGIGHAPSPVQAEEAGHPATGNAALDLPDWLADRMAPAFGPAFADVAQALRQRAPVFLRANMARTTRDGAIAALAQDDIVARPHSLCDTALEVTEGAKRIQTSAAYLQGLVELQDAASQAVVRALPLQDGMRVLDHCAGGGGKTLAMAALARLQIFAHDASPNRMRDLPARAARAGARITQTDAPERHAPYDLVVADAPCSGSGSWRRDPQGKWTLTPERLAQIGQAQTQILDRIAPMVAAKGWLAYATCSLLEEENGGRVTSFLQRHPEWQCAREVRLTPLQGGDGFYLALLTR